VTYPGPKTAGRQWFTVATTANRYPADGQGAVTATPGSSVVPATANVMLDGIVVDTLAGSAPSVTITDGAGNDIETFPYQAVSSGRGTEFLNMQRGVVNYGAAGFTASTTISAVVLANAFPNITGILHSDAGRSVPDTVAQTNTGVGESIGFSDTTHIAHTQTSTADAGVDHRLAYEVWEHTGAAGNANEFIVRSAADVVIADVSLTTTTAAISAIVDTAKCVAVLLGVRNNRSAAAWDSATPNVVVNADKTVTVSRGNSSGAATYSIAIVEFTGSNWTVRTFSQVIAAAGSRQSTALSASIPAWNKAFIVGHYKDVSGAVNNRDNSVLFLPPAAGTTTLDILLGASATTGGTAQGYVVYNADADFSVIHDNSFDGGLADFATTDQVKSYTISAVDLATTALLVYGSAQGATAVIPAGVHMNYRYSSTTAIELWRGRTSGNAVDVQFQIIKTKSSGLTYPQRSVGRSYLPRRKGKGHGLRIRGGIGAHVNDASTQVKVCYRSLE
jgi:hypothetical protein